MADYEKVRVAVDATIFTIKDRKLQILLHTREKEPFSGRKELPGGLLLKDETAETTLKRKLHEVVGHKEIFFQQFGTFTDPKRDPRERTASIAFIALINHERIGNIAGEYEWHDSAKLPSLAFDHKEIIEQAKTHLKENISSIIVKQFLPPLFPLNKLQEAHEIIEGEVQDNRNFRKKMLTTGIVIETKQTETNVSHRPAKLFKFSKE